MLPTHAPNSPQRRRARRGDVFPIAPGVPVASRDVLRAVMRPLRAVERRNVVVLGRDGTLHANRAALLSAFEAVTVPDGARLGDGGFDLTGLLRALVPDALGRGVTPSCHSEKSGPYRRVYSKPGYAYVAARVYLPSDMTGEMHENKDAGHGDTAFIYLGGWGSRGGAVDAGFQHGHYAKKPQDDWAPFFLVQQVGARSAITVSKEKQASGAPWRLRGGQEVSVKFWVTRVQDGTHLNLFMQGVLSEDGTEACLTLSAPVDERFGWDATGGRNVMKRMTTIGQTYEQENLTSGSFMHGVRWSDAVIGATEADAHPWTANDTGGYCSFPDPKTPEGKRADDPSRGKWEVKFVSAAEETDSITLS